MDRTIVLLAAAVTERHQKAAQASRRSKIELDINSLNLIGRKQLQAVDQVEPGAVTARSER